MTSTRGAELPEHVLGLLKLTGVAGHIQRAEGLLAAWRSHPLCTCPPYVPTAKSITDAARDALDESRNAEGGVSGTPLWLACLAARNGAPGAIELARAMVDKGADVTIPGTQGVAGDTTTPLWWASASVEAGAGAGAADLAKRLIDAGADVDAEGTYDTVRGPPLLWAAVAVRNGEETNGLALAAVLLSAGADPNLRGSYGPTAVGVTPLVLAAQAAPENGGCVRLCASLLESGAAMDANEMSSLLMYRVGSSLVAVKNMLKGGRGD